MAFGGFRALPFSSINGKPASKNEVTIKTGTTTCSGHSLSLLLEPKVIIRMGFAGQSRCISLAVIFVLASMAAQVTSRDLEDAAIYDKYEEWIIRYGKIYKDEKEKETRFKIFKINAELIELSNSSPNKPYKLGLNQFADLTKEEFIAFNGGPNYRITSTENNVRSSFKYENVSLSAIPSSVDWRSAGAVTAVKNQGGCGCCWAFSAIAAMEGAIKLAGRQMASLSPQELLDCDATEMNRGCWGGYAKEAFKYVINKKGISAEGRYPYKGAPGRCRRSPIAGTIKGFELVPGSNEDALLKVVAHQPVSVSLASGSDAFRFYKSGILIEGCDTYVNHEVTVVGYGSDFFNTKYWLMKNSWGTGWGEDGYIRIKRQVASKDGMCGLARYPSYPIA